MQQNNQKMQAIKALTIIPGIGKSLAEVLLNLNIQSIADSKGKNADTLFALSNIFAGLEQDKCVIFVFRCATYYANTPLGEHEIEKLKWWN